MAKSIFGQDQLSGHNFMRVSPAGGLYVHCIDSVALSAVNDLSGEISGLYSDVDALSTQIEINTSNIESISADSINVQILELKDAVKVSNNDYYTELTYDGSNPTNIDKWEDETKVTKLFSKELIWLSGNVTEITITDETTSKTLSSVYSYTGSNITSIKEILI